MSSLEGNIPAGAELVTQSCMAGQHENLGWNLTFTCVLLIFIISLQFKNDASLNELAQH